MALPAEPDSDDDSDNLFPGSIGATRAALSRCISCVTLLFCSLLFSPVFLLGYAFVYLVPDGGGFVRLRVVVVYLLCQAQTCAPPSLLMRQRSQGPPSPGQEAPGA